jgi:hypothetical protein
MNTERKKGGERGELNDLFSPDVRRALACFVFLANWTQMHTPAEWGSSLGFQLNPLTAFSEFSSALRGPATSVIDSTAFRLADLSL